MNLLPKFLILIVLFLLPLSRSYSQDSLKYSIGYDVIKGAIDEHSLTFGYHVSKKYLVTFSAGYTYYNKFLRDKFYWLSPRQEKYPILLYQGPTFRTGHFIKFESMIAGIELFYKHLYYNNQSFNDSYGDQDGDTFFTRDEKANVIGAHLMVGFIGKLRKHPHLYVNPMFGFGYSIKYRTYTTTKTEYTERPLNPPLGTYSTVLKYKSVVFSLNIGVRL